MTQMNPLEVYSETGRKAGEAVNHHDAALAKFYNNWLRRALSLESTDYAAIAGKAYEDAYKTARGY
jgi:hypothetical protein